jgi:serine/threonine-protein kinase RsbW
VAADDPNLLVTLPPRPQHLALVRRVLGGYASHLGMREEGVGDLKTVVSEACAIAVNASPGARGSPVQIEASCDGADIAVAVRDRGNGLGGIRGADGESPRLGMRLIAALSGRFDVVESPHGTEINISMPLH